MNKRMSQTRKSMPIFKLQCPNVQIAYIEKEQIDLLSPFLAQKWAGVLAVPRTHQTHCVQTSGRDKLMVVDTSDSTEFRIVRTKKVSPEKNKNQKNKNQKKTSMAYRTHQLLLMTKKH